MIKTEGMQKISPIEGNLLLTNLLKNYLVTYSINLEDNSFCTFSALENVDHIVSKSENAQEAMNSVVNKVVRPKFQDAMRAFVDLDTLPQRLEGNDSVDMDYQGSLTGWCNAKFIPLNYDDEGSLTEVVFLVEHVHNKRIEADIYKNVLECNSDLVYYFDLTEGMITEDTFQQTDVLVPKGGEVKLPLEYDQFVHEYFQSLGVKPIGENEKIYTRKEILDMYNAGVTRFKADYYAEKLDRYFSSEFYLMDDYESKHIMAMVVRSDITNEYHAYLKNKQEEEQKQSEKRLFDAALSAFSDSYSNIFIAITSEDKAMFIKKDGYIPEGLSYTENGFINYTESFDSYVEQRVAEEDKERVRNAMKPSNIEQLLVDRHEYSLTYHVIEDGVYHDYEARIIKTDREGYYVIGFNNIDALLAEEKRQNELFRQAAESLKQSRLYLHAIGNSYDYMVVTNLSQNTYICPIANEIMGWNIPEEGTFENLISRMVPLFPNVDQDYQRRNRSIDAHIKRFEKGKSYYEERYQIYDIHGCLHWINERTMYIKDESEDIIGVSLCNIIDADVKTEATVRQITEALSKDYTNVYIMCPRANEITPVLLKGYVVKHLNREPGAISPYRELVKEYAEARIVEQDHERFYEATSAEYIEKVLKTKDELVFSYRINDNGAIHDYQMKIIRTNEVDKYILAFKNIDALMDIHRDRVNLELEMERLNARNQMLGASVITIARMVDAKDIYTAKHSARVTKYSLLIGEAIGLDAKDLENLERSAMLHDIGKVRIPDGILTKKGKLSKEEYQIMKEHPVYGAEILKEMYFAPQISEGAHYHHERYDGKGYPNGLSGENIPLFGRIIAIADAYDAMSSNRTYRPKCDDDYILKEFKEGRGTQFDPKLCDIFVEMIENGVVESSDESHEVLNLENAFEKFGGRYNLAKKRFKTDERIKSYLAEFLKDEEFDKLEKALAEGKAAEAFQAVHTMKGLAMSLDFINMEKICISLTENLRGKPITADSQDLFTQLEKEYNEVCSVIKSLLCES